MLPPQGNALSFDPERQVSTMGFNVQKLVYSGAVCAGSQSQCRQVSVQIQRLQRLRRLRRMQSQSWWMQSCQKQAQAALHGSSGRSRQWRGASDTQGHVPDCEGSLAAASTIPRKASWRYAEQSRPPSRRSWPDQNAQSEQGHRSMHRLWAGWPVVQLLQNQVDLQTEGANWAAAWPEPKQTPPTDSSSASSDTELCRSPSQTCTESAWCRSNCRIRPAPRRRTDLRTWLQLARRTEWSTDPEPQTDFATHQRKEWRKISRLLKSQ